MVYVRFGMMLGLFLSQGKAFSDCIREPLQQKFALAGDFTKTADWQEQVAGQPISCQGIVTHVVNTQAAKRIEVMLRLLEDTRLYDTVLQLEGPAYEYWLKREPLASGQMVQFKGKIVRGVDLFGLKHVFVRVDDPQQLVLE
ncbi:MAG: hypothetical protein VKJ06_05200 [Vampirovibrionales bacterium]|nr:hypothetical protein [Vampirovibrionales bacterium]